MDDPVSIHGSRLASIAERFAGGSAGGGPSPVLLGGGVGMVLLSAISSVIAAGLLPARIRIHWTFGLGPYYGPEVAPSVLILAAFPVLIAGTAVLAAGLDALLGKAPEYATIRPYYVLAMLGTLAGLLGTQLLIIVANL